MNIKFVKVMSEIASLRTTMASVHDGINHKGLE